MIINKTVFPREEQWSGCKDNTGCMELGAPLMLTVLVIIISKVAGGTVPVEAPT